MENEKSFLTIDEAARLTGLSRYYLRARARKGEIPVIRCGKKFCIDVEGLLNQLHREAEVTQW